MPLSWRKHKFSTDNFGFVVVFQGRLGHTNFTAFESLHNSTNLYAYKCRWICYLWISRIGHQRKHACKMYAKVARITIQSTSLAAPVETRKHPFYFWEDSYFMLSEKSRWITNENTISNGACAHNVMVSKFQWKPFWLATQRDSQNDWTATQNRVNYDVFAQAQSNTKTSARHLLSTSEKDIVSMFGKRHTQWWTVASQRGVAATDCFLRCQVPNHNAAWVDKSRQE